MADCVRLKLAALPCAGFVVERVKVDGRDGDAIGPSLNEVGAFVQQVGGDVFVDVKEGDQGPGGGVVGVTGGAEDDGKGSVGAASIRVVPAVWYSGRHHGLLSAS